MDITPSVNLLRSYRAERVVYDVLISEAIDNALDAGATLIDARLSEDEVTITDNGRGVSKARFKALFCIGDHEPMATTQLGRFGIGMTVQALNAGDLFAVDSVSSDGRMGTEVNWRNVLRGGRWEIEDPVWSPSVVGSPTGTTVTISKLRFVPRITTDRLLSVLAQRFYPAIRDGAIIRVNGVRVPLLIEPSLTDVIDVSLGLSKGRGAHLRAGILLAQGTVNRVHVAYKHRVIMPASSLGCGEVGGGLNKIFARIQLTGTWRLERFKTDLPDDIERDELDEAVLEKLLPILKKCSTASTSAKLAELTVRVNELVPDALAARRPHHLQPPQNRRGQKRGQRGYVDPEKSEQGGPARGPRQPALRKPKNELLITFDGNDNEHGIGIYQPGRPHRVDLAPDQPTNAMLISHRDGEMAAKVLTELALILYEQGICVRDPELPFVTFGKRIAQHMAVQETQQKTAASAS